MLLRRHNAAAAPTRPRRDSPATGWAGALAAACAGLLGRASLLVWGVASLLGWVDFFKTAVYAVCVCVCVCVCARARARVCVYVSAPQGPWRAAVALEDRRDLPRHLPPGDQAGTAANGGRAARRAPAAFASARRAAAKIAMRRANAAICSQGIKDVGRAEDHGEDADVVVPV